MRKNVASQIVGAQLVSASDGSAFTGAVTVSVTGDGGTQATGSVGAGACTHEGNGFHTYAPAQAETNYDHVAFTFTGTGAVPVTVQVYTSFPQTGDSFARIGANGAGLTALGDTRIANLDAAVSSRSSHSAADVWGVGTRTLSAFGFSVTVGGYAAGQDPATLLDARFDAVDTAIGNLSFPGVPANFENLSISAAGVVKGFPSELDGTAIAGQALAVNEDGQIEIDLTQAVPTSNTAQTLGDCLNAARAQGFGKWVLVGTTLTLYASDGTTPVRAFVVDSPTNPTSRT